MSLIDLIKNKGKSTREFMGVRKIGDNYLETDHGNQFYYYIQPTNVSVLSEDALYVKINALMTVLRGHTEVELACINSRENFDANKQYLRERIREERTLQSEKKLNTNTVIELLEKDLAYYDKIQTQTVTARQFLLIIRYPEEIKKETSSFLSQIERLVRQQGFVIKQADKAMLKQILAVYWNQNVTTEYFEDYDGERWVISGEQ